MNEPKLTHVFSIFADIATPRNAGPSPLGARLHIPITGGRVDGPKLKGRVLPGGSDWPVIMPDGNSQIDAHYSIELDDGTLIYVHNKGMRISSQDALSRVREGEELPSEEFYMFAAPVFDAPNGVHQWLRERIFVSKIKPSTESVIVDVYVVD